jgi:hypothetical protein
VTINEGQGPIAAEQLRKVFEGKIGAAGGFQPDTAELAIANGVADAWPSGVTSWQILTCRYASGTALRLQGMTEIRSCNRGPFAADGIVGMKIAECYRPEEIASREVAPAINSASCLRAARPSFKLVHRPEGAEIRR